jgi:hypothetical protein
MKISEVHFNHDTSSATADAYNIRQNTSGLPIAAPEWKDGVPPLPAAYARDALGTTVTIKARVVEGPAGATLPVRAVDPWVPPVNRGGCLGWIIVLIAKLMRALFGNVLGDVKQRMVSFDLAGDSGLQLFELENHSLALATVGIRHTTWTWQARVRKTWVDIGSTQHKIYVTLNVPTLPWQQSGISSNNIQLPWADALEKACTWALGANSLDDVGARITQAINTRPNATYTPVTMFGSVSYSLTGYMNALDSSMSFVMNCRDSANAVATFANLLGANLNVGMFTSMNTRKFLTLSGDPAIPADWVSWSWGWHEIVWVNPTMGPDELIYDGCLRVDIDNNYGDAIHVAQHPIKMKFGTTNDGTNYRYRLIETGTGNPAPPTVRRPVA